MSAQKPNPTGWRNWRIAGALILGAIGIVAANSYGRSIRNEELQFEIKKSGGDCTLGTPLLQSLRSRALKQDSWVYPTDVLLKGAMLDHAWLDQHEYLSGLGIDRLWLQNSPLTGVEIAKILDENPIYDLDARFLTSADVAALALGHGRRAIDTNLAFSDLTDDGFRNLPLEHLEVLEIEGTRITPHGLRELSRCVNLQYIALDGKQFTADIARILGTLPSFYGLKLYGRHVTDDHVRGASSIERLEYLWLTELNKTQVSEAAIRDLQEDKPSVELDFGPADPDDIETLP